MFDLGDCTSALPLLQSYFKKANWLANVISSGLDPFYNASRDDRDLIEDDERETLIFYESMANNYKKQRNISIAMQGECLMKIGKPNEALPYLTKALDLFDIREKWWKRTRNNLYRIIQVN